MKRSLTVMQQGYSVFGLSSCVHWSRIYMCIPSVFPRSLEHCLPLPPYLCSDRSAIELLLLRHVTHASSSISRSDRTTNPSPPLWVAGEEVGPCPLKIECPLVSILWRVGADRPIWTYIYHSSSERALQTIEMCYSYACLMYTAYFTFRNSLIRTVWIKN